MRFCVYQGIPTLINLAYKNRGHAQVVATNLKQWRMYNITMSCGRSHCIDDPLDMGLYIQQENIRFYHTICKCTKNIKEVIG
jgi:hypothetical protein